VCPGSGGHLPGGAAGPPGRPVLYGQDLYRHLRHGDVCQVVGPRLRQVLYQRLVLAGLCHRYGEVIFVFDLTSFRPLFYLPVFFCCSTNV
jgi:hypothetical protein